MVYMWNIHDCMFNFELHKVNFQNFANHTQHVYCIYDVPSMQVASIGQICFYNIWYYVAKAFTA